MAEPGQAQHRPAVRLASPDNPLANQVRWLATKVRPELLETVALCAWGAANGR